ncbi:uracil-DNA glycosylase [Paraburkholderia pallida]|nr:uracil-DNA glycosylase [Paraburkholderia pallida]
MTAAQDFVQRLAQWPRMANVFNPWSEADERDAPAVDAPAIRQQQLAAYLECRQASATVILIAEALSYRGGRFTGIAMTSERILLGKDPVLNERATRLNLNPLCDLRPGLAMRTSNPGKLARDTDRKDGVYERTASIVWRTMLDNGFAPMDFALWNALPFHPFIAGNTQSNRSPSSQELLATKRILADFISLFSRPVHFVALGRKAERALGDHLPAPVCEQLWRARHPAARGQVSPTRMLDDVVRELTPLQ